MDTKDKHKQADSHKHTSTSQRIQRCRELICKVQVSTVSKLQHPLWSSVLSPLNKSDEELIWYLHSQSKTIPVGL